MLAVARTVMQVGLPMGLLELLGPLTILHARYVLLVATPLRPDPHVAQVALRDGTCTLQFHLHILMREVLNNLEKLRQAYAAYTLVRKATTRRVKVDDMVRRLQEMLVCHAKQDDMPSMMVQACAHYVQKENLWTHHSTLKSVILIANGVDRM